MLKSKARGLLVVAAGTASALVACGSTDNMVHGFVVFPDDGGAHDATVSCGGDCGPLGLIGTPLDGAADATGQDATGACENDTCGLVAPGLDGGVEADAGEASAPSEDGRARSVKATFELEWLGGVAEHHFRRARPGADELPWGTLDATRYPPALVDAARGSWTEVAISEYRAVASFAEVVRALTEARAPLDLIGMTGDFLADEARHVELASRVAMELGGAAPRAFDPDDFGLRIDRRLSAFQRANELVLRVGCVAEAFAGGTAAGSLRVAAHPLTRAVLEMILADEARDRRLGGLYFDWAGERFDDAERARLANVLHDALAGHAVYWQRKTSEVRDGMTLDGFRVEHLHELGWLESARAVPLARKVVEEDILAPLSKLGITLTNEQRRGLSLLA